jgi:hypothetical protein
LLLTKEEEPEVGTDVMAIGTPKNIELGQTVSKGIISGLRNGEDSKLIQTDVPINGGNSGGALIDKSGNVLGVVSSKLYSGEGIGFAIRSLDVFKGLKLDYLPAPSETPAATAAPAPIKSTVGPAKPASMPAKASGKIGK